MTLKNADYILTVPSYIIPGTYLENVNYLKSIPEIKGVELLFFFYDEQTRNLFLKEKNDIKKHTDRFFFTVHMPDLIKLEHEIILKMTFDFVSHYIVHPPESGAEITFLNLIKTWSQKYKAVFVLENIVGRDWQSVISMTELLLCVDTGHLLLTKQNPLSVINQCKSKIREIHLHGLSDYKKQQKENSLTGMDHETENSLKDHGFITGLEEWFKEIIPFIKTYHGFLNIEVFNEQNLKLCLECLKNI